MTAVDVTAPEVAIARIEVMLTSIRADVTDMKEVVHELSAQVRGLSDQNAVQRAELSALRDRVKALEDARSRDTERRPAWWSVAVGVCGFVTAVVVALKGGGG